MPTDSNKIPGLLSQHVCDIGVTLDFRLPEKSKNTAGGPESFKIGWFVVCVVVNAKNPVRKITLEDLQGVFAARIALWQEIEDSRTSGRVEIYRPSAFSTQGMIFQKKVLLGKWFADQPLMPSATPRRGKKSDAGASMSEEGDAPSRTVAAGDKQTDAGVIAAVARQPNAIGFVFYPCDGSLDKRIRILGIIPSKDALPVLPSASTVADGSYPLVDSLTLYLHADCAFRGQGVQRFCYGAESGEDR